MLCELIAACQPTSARSRRHAPMQGQQHRHSARSRTAVVRDRCKRAPRAPCAIAPVLPGQAPGASRSAPWPSVSSAQPVRGVRRAQPTSVFLAILNLAQLVCLLTVLAVQLALLIEAVQHSETAHTAVSARTAIAAPLPTSHVPFTLVQGQPLLLLGAIVSAAISRFLRPKQCAPAVPSFVRLWGLWSCGSVIQLDS